MNDIEWGESNSQAHIVPHGQFSNAWKREKNFRTSEDHYWRHKQHSVFFPLVTYSSVMFSTRWHIMGWEVHLIVILDPFGEGSLGAQWVLYRLCSKHFYILQLFYLLPLLTYFWKCMNLVLTDLQCHFGSFLLRYIQKISSLAEAQHIVSHNHQSIISSNYSYHWHQK